MTPQEFVEFQRDNSSSDIPEDNFDQANSYDVVYRSLAYMLSEEYCGGLNMALSLEEAKDFLIQAHPYFVYLFSKEDEVKQFEHLHKFFIDSMKPIDW